MSLSLTHTKVATLPDDPSVEVGADEWNDQHVITQATGTILGRIAAGTGVTQELTPAQGRTLLALDSASLVVFAGLGLAGISAPAAGLDSGDLIRGRTFVESNGAFALDAYWDGANWKRRSTDLPFTISSDGTLVSLSAGPTGVANSNIGFVAGLTLDGTGAAAAPVSFSTPTLGVSGFATLGRLTMNALNLDNSELANFGNLTVVSDTTVGYPAIGYNIRSGNAANTWRYRGADNTSWLQFRGQTAYFFNNSNAVVAGNIITKRQLAVIGTNFLGIGDSSIASTFGTLVLYSNVSGGNISGTVNFDGSAGGGVTVRLLGVNNGGLLVDDGGGTYYFGVNSSRAFYNGPMMVGSTSTPQARLHVKAAASSLVSLGLENTNGGTDSKYLDILNNNTQLTFRFVNDAISAANNIWVVTRSGYTVSSHIWYVGSSTAQLQMSAGVLTLNSADQTINGGSLLLAATASQSTTKLYSYNNGAVLFVIQPAGTNTIALGDAVDFDRVVGMFYVPGTTGAIAGHLYFGQTNKNNANYTHGKTSFWTNGTQRLTIDSAGSVLIGATTAPASVNSAYAGLWIGGNTMFYGVIAPAAGQAAGLATNVYLDSSGTLRHVSTGTSSILVMSPDAWYISFCGNVAAGATITGLGFYLHVSTNGFGYGGSGTGGTVVQATNKNTAVVLNKVCGTITTAADNLAAGGIAAFTVTNSKVAANDVIIVQRLSGGTQTLYTITVAAVAAGSFVIRIMNDGGAEAAAIVIGFAVIKATNS